MAIDEQAKPSTKIGAYFLARIPISDVEFGPAGQPRALSLSGLCDLRFPSTIFSGIIDRAPYLHKIPTTI
jgi:hypothetical protein